MVHLHCIFVSNEDTGFEVGMGNVKNGGVSKGAVICIQTNNYLYVLTRYNLQLESLIYDIVFNR